MPAKTNKPFVIDVSGEVINKSGGVYTVLSTKANQMVKYYGEKYLIIGIFTPRSETEFVADEIPESFKGLFSYLEKKGIKVHYGRWLTEGEPRLILLEADNHKTNAVNVILEIEKKYGIKILDTIKSDKKVHQNYVKNIKWVMAVKLLIKELLKLSPYSGKNVVLHFNDTALTLPADIVKEGLNAAVAMTMHSTNMGRVLSIQGESIKELMKKYKKNREKIVKQKISRLQGTKRVNYILDNVNLNHADVVTAVSRVTSYEVEFFHGRKVDVITPNGLPSSMFQSLQEQVVKHEQAKEKIYRFLSAYFLPYQHVDVPHSLLFFTSGRYELTTKGYELLIDSLGSLNKRLKKSGYNNTIFVFLFIMINRKLPDKNISDNLSIYDLLDHSIENELPHVEKRLLSQLTYGKDINAENLLDTHFLIESKKLMLKFRKFRNKTPPLMAFKGVSANNPLVKLLHKNKLTNNKDDKVKVIFYPAPVAPDDGLISMPYEEVTKGMHIGIFPSLYEPWGYTPQEAATNRTLSITTDLSGFGNFVDENPQAKSKKGIWVLKADKRTKKQITNQLTDILFEVAKMSRNERIERSIESHKIAKLTSWENFAKFYFQAHNLAVQKMKKRSKSRDNL